jgi:glycine cleavage system aminomethyltransferase T
VTSALASRRLQANVALGYVRKECNAPGTELVWRGAAGEAPVRIVPLPFAA